MEKKTLSLDINEFETVMIDGDIDNYNFDLLIYSEAFGLWVLQDLVKLENLKPEKYKTLVERVEKYLIKKAA